MKSNKSIQSKSIDDYLRELGERWRGPKRQLVVVSDGPGHFFVQWSDKLQPGDKDVQS